MILWFYDSMILWFYDFMILWFYDSMILWFYDSMFYDFMILWFMILWFYDSMMYLLYDVLMYWFIYFLIQFKLIYYSKIFAEQLSILSIKTLFHSFLKIWVFVIKLLIIWMYYCFSEKYCWCITLNYYREKCFGIKLFDLASEESR